MNLDLYDDTGTDSIYVCVRNNNATYFDSFGGEYITQEIKKIIANQNIIASISRLQAFDSVIREYFYNGFINFILDKKSLTDFTMRFCRKW